MKLRIFENAIRIRLAGKEVQELFQNGAIESEFLFPNKTRLQYSIKISDAYSVLFNDSIIRITIPQKETNWWFESKDRLSLKSSIRIDNNHSIQLLIEKDLKS